MGTLILLLTTAIWGSAFIAQKVGADSLGPFAITAFRSILGSLFLLVLVAFRRGKSHPSGKNAAPNPYLAGVACGASLFAAMVAQQIGIEYTLPGISAFLTTNYVLFVPVIAALLTRKLPKPYVFAGVAMSLIGTYFICMGGGQEGGVSFSGIGRGEAWTILCAVLFAIQMITVDHFAKRGTDILIMSAMQLATCAMMGLAFLFLPSESARLTTNLLGNWSVIGSILYLGIFSSGIAYTMQNYAQARISPSLAAIVLSLESVFGVLFGWLLRGDVLSSRQLVGCGIVFAAVLSSQLLEMRCKNVDRNVA